MLLRKVDMHDRTFIRHLLERGADPNRMTGWGVSALHHALRRDNDLETIESLLDHGGKPALEDDHGQSAAVVAARRGRGDVLELFERRGMPSEFHGGDTLIAACARNDPTAISGLVALDPSLAAALLDDGGPLLAAFAGVGNTDGVQCLLDVGVSVSAPYTAGDGYFDIATNSLALHVAAWRARHATVKLLIDRGSPIDLPDGRGRTPLALAVRACVASYWTDRRSPESVDALLRAGASVRGVQFPSGYAEVDELLAMSIT